MEFRINPTLLSTKLEVKTVTKLDDGEDDKKLTEIRDRDGYHGIRIVSIHGVDSCIFMM